MVAISADTLESHQRFQEREGAYPFPLASDPELGVIKAYGVLNDEGKRSLRAVFVVDADGYILHRNPFYSPSNLDHYRAIFQALGLLG